MTKKFGFVSIFALALTLVAAPAGAFFMWDDNDITIGNTNAATVTNDIEAKSNTGKNDANWNKGLGKIVTGDALSVNDVSTAANLNDIDVTADCNCKGDITIGNTNAASVLNDLDAKSNTGYNDANGNGKSYHHGPVMLFHMMPQMSSKGAGIIRTGDAQSGNTVATVVNSNVIKVTKP